MSSRDETILAASRAAIALFLESGSSAWSVKALAEHTGLSERTFYRYFPRKEDIIRPFIDAVLARLVADVRAYPRSRPLREALIAAHARAFQEGGETHWDALLPLFQDNERLRAVWVQVVADAEAAFAAVIAERLGTAPDSRQARLAAAVVTTAGRFALEQPRTSDHDSPAEVFAQSLDLLGDSLFTPR